MTKIKHVLFINSSFNQAWKPLWGDDCTPSSYDIIMDDNLIIVIKTEDNTLCFTFAVNDDMFPFMCLLVVQQCDQGTARNRSRHILRHPASTNPACPDLVQSEPCVLNSTCFTYQHRVSGRTVAIWQGSADSSETFWGSKIMSSAQVLPGVHLTVWLKYSYVAYVCVCVADWSTCQLSENAICGQGSRLRLLDCVRSDGKIVELQKCQQVILVSSRRVFPHCPPPCKNRVQNLHDLQCVCKIAHWLMNVIQLFS